MTEQQVGPGLRVKLGVDYSEMLGVKGVGGIAIALNQAIELFQKFEAQAQKYGQITNELRDLSYTTGIHTDNLQRMQYAAVLSGTSNYTLSTSLNKLTLSVSEFDDESSKASQAFQRLGIDPTGKPIDQVFNETSRALMGVRDETTRNALAMDLYGRSWQDLVPYMETYLQKQNEIGKAPIFSEKEITELQNANTEWQKLNNNLTIYTGKALTFIEEANQKAKKYNLFAWALGMNNPEADTPASAIPETKVKAAADPNRQQSSNRAFADSIDQITGAMKGYQQAVEKVASAQQKLNDINKDFARQMSITDIRDTSSIRNLIIQRNWDIEDQQASIGSAKSNLQASATKAAGAAKRYGDVIIQIGEYELKRVVGVAIAEGNRSNGVGLY